MKKSIFFGFGAVAILLTVFNISSCSKDKTETPVVVEPPLCDSTLSFSAEVEPIIIANCSTSGCHDAGTAQSGYNLVGHSNIGTHADAILEAIKHENSGSPMPLGQPKLNDSLIQKFSCWIDLGKLDN